MFDIVLVAVRAKNTKNLGMVPDWVGGKNLFTCVFWGSFLMGEKEHINKIPQKSRNNPVKTLFLCLFLGVSLFLFTLNFGLPKVEVIVLVPSQIQGLSRPPCGSDASGACLV